MESMMAVQKMKLVNIGGPVDGFDSIMSTCVVNREFHPENAMDIMQYTKVLRKMDEPNPYIDPLRRTVTIAEQLGVKLDYRNFSETEFRISDMNRICENLFDKISRMRKESERLLNVAVQNEQIIRQLDHIHGINADLHEFFQTYYVKFRFGRIPKEVYDHFSDDFDRSFEFYFFPTSIERDYVYAMILTTRVNEDKVDALFASYRFERIFIANKVYGSSDSAKQMLQEEIDKSRNEAGSLAEEAEKLIRDSSDSFLSYYSFIRFKSDTFDLRKYAVCSETSFFIYGWVPGDCIDEFTGNLEMIPNLIYSVDEPLHIGEIDPPVVLRNAKIFKPFEPFVEMYGRPSYNEMDPTPLMAILYTIFFGIMFGDIGQGFILAIVGYCMGRFKKMWLGKVLVYAGIAGIGFGFFYGSVFGFEHLLPFGFKVLESGANTNQMLQTAVFIGVAVITMVMGLNVLNGFKQKDYEKALFSQNGVAGIILYLSIMCLVLPMLGFLDLSISSPFFLIAGVYIPLIAIVCRHPLGKILSGDPHWKPDNILDFLLENVFELVEILLSFIANTISFLRIGIFALSHAGMMMVVFLLAGENENPIAIIIGNIVVMGIEGLLVAIQVLRLNYYEMFGRFFTAEGRAYHPVMIDYKTIKE